MFEEDKNINDLKEIIHDPEGDVWEDELSLEVKQQFLVPIDVHLYKNKV